MLITILCFTCFPLVWSCIKIYNCCLPSQININAFSIYLCVSFPSWRPYLFGAGCFSIKTPWWVFPIHFQHAFPSLQQTTAFIPSFIDFLKPFLGFFSVYSSTLWEELKDVLFIVPFLFPLCMWIAVWLYCQIS